MARAVEDILAVWRSGERLLGVLPDTSPDRAAVAREVEAMRSLYQSLTGQAAMSRTMLSRAKLIAAEARATIERAEDRVNAAGGTGPGPASSSEPAS
ncbi:MAG TPA: hypothetical protein VFS32_01420 [Candidatus Limnocylindrales bacterium]|nr:hypothetical protein [Candidatus Limnocylindrales bacterium]